MQPLAARRTLHPRAHAHSPPVCSSSPPLLRSPCRYRSAIGAEMAGVMALEKVRLLRDFPPYTHPSPCERRGALAPAPPARLYEHARMFSIPGPHPPTEALLARMVHRRAIFFCRARSGLALRSAQSAS